MNLLLVIGEQKTMSDIEREASTSPLVNDVYRVSTDTLLVRSPLEPTTLGTLTGITGEDDDSQVGVIFKLNGSYHGFYKRELWNWLTENRVEA